MMSLPIISINSFIITSVLVVTNEFVAVDGFAPSTHGLVPAALLTELYGKPL